MSNDKVSAEAMRKLSETMFYGRIDEKSGISVTYFQDIQHLVTTEQLVDALMTRGYRVVLERPSGK